jgi:hypothetical protein
VGTKVPTTLEQPGETKFDGVSLAGLWRGTEKTLADRMLVVNYSRMPFGVNRPTADHPGTPRKEGAAVMWRRWRLLEDKMLFDLATDPQQERNVIDEHPEVAAKMREHLNAWWNGVKDTVNEPSRVVIGAEAENPTMLTACEWFDVFVDQQRQVRAADPKVGVWHLEVARGGEYTIELRRYPREAGLAIGQGIPVTRVVDGQFIAGRELPVARARLKIGGHEEAIDLEKDAASATFRVALESGPVELETCFYDAQGNEICGAYFAYVQRTGASR